jgi:hypothetical protein
MNEHPAGLLHAVTTPVDWALVVLAAAVVLWAFYSAVRYTIRPGEEDPHHVKRRIVVDEDTGEDPSLS